METLSPDLIEALRQGRATRPSAPRVHQGQVAIAEVIRNVMPKWRARQVTVSPSFITPLVTPPIVIAPSAGGC